MISFPAAVDYIRFEKNLLQMGFFGAHDTRHKSRSTRRIEQIVTRDGQKIRVSAEFRASEQFGLPSTSDRDKYLAFMKIAMEEKTRRGAISNPIRFTGYRLLKEMGLSYSGENYEDINRWGQRMVDTTITSEQVIYLAATKRYVNKTVHVFRSFTRAGQSNLDDTGKTESYEVMLEDWLLENLNQRYVVPEDLNAYRKLKRPTGKGIFGYLHLWFHASRGRQIEKDYGELCVLLNIPAYRHVSKIRDTMGRSLDELVAVGYLCKWDIRPMSTKEGYKLVLLPGEELLHVLAISQRKEFDEQLQSHGELPAPPESDAAAQRARDALLQRGISPSKADLLVRQHDANEIVDQIEYSEFLIASDRRRKFDNPAGFLIYMIENQVTVPTSFVTSRRLREAEQKAQQQLAKDVRLYEMRLEYDTWSDDQVEQELAAQFPDTALMKKLKEVIAQRVRHDEQFGQMTGHQQEAIALQLLRRDTKDDLVLPSFEQWCKQRHQLNLFGGGA